MHKPYANPVQEPDPADGHACGMIPEIDGRNGKDARRPQKSTGG
jgi:hypothetical protein